MKISDKIKELTFKAQKLAFPDQGEDDYDKFVTLTICPLGIEYGFQVWFDKWQLGPRDAIHEGTLFPFVEMATLPLALSELENSLSEYEEEINPGVPETITLGGRTYRLEK